MKQVIISDRFKRKLENELKRKTIDLYLCQINIKKEDAEKQDFCKDYYDFYLKENLNYIICGVYKDEKNGVKDKLILNPHSDYWIHDDRYNDFKKIKKINSVDYEYKPEHQLELF